MSPDNVQVWSGVPYDPPGSGGLALAKFFHQKSLLLKQRLGKGCLRKEVASKILLRGANPLN
ncbi:hypothetical protein HKBW3S09_01632, partial [Candidatus Hakubella thermalkaliphila]